MIALYLDGGYLDVLSRVHGVRLNFAALIGYLSDGKDLLRAYYYHCLPYQSDPPTEEESRRFAGAQRFFERLQAIPRIEIRLGRLAADRDASGAIVGYTQKRVDTKLGVDMALLAGKGRVSLLGLVSGDSDHCPAIEAVKQEGVQVILWHGPFDSACAPSRELWKLCDDRHVLDQPTLAKLARPA
jgi:uncharacterized LabA/DUF88 family protein